MFSINEIGKRAKAAGYILALATDEKNRALIRIAKALKKNSDDIIRANDIDIANGRESGMTESMLDRLKLDENRLDSMSRGILDIAGMGDPIGRVISGEVRPNGLNIRRVTIPLGVIGIIFEARPNVTSDAAALCLKSGNSVILRGGKEAINSNTAIVDVMRHAVAAEGLPADSIQLISDTSRQSARDLMALTDYLDVIIPRGGNGLIRAVVENSSVPVIQTGAGNCHVYVDKYADIDMAAKIIFNAKTSRPSVCNAIETVLVHQEISDEALPKIKALLDTKGVEIRGCEKTMAILGGDVIAATDEDYFTEFLDFILAVKVVKNISTAIEHINNYSSSHSEAIITKDFDRAKMFEMQVDSAAVYVNASTRFTDGAEFGLGAEIGISTQKLHARGPMGLAQLTSSKYIIEGSGQIR